MPRSPGGEERFLLLFPTLSDGNRFGRIHSAGVGGDELGIEVRQVEAKAAKTCQHDGYVMLMVVERFCTTHSEIPMRSSRRAVNGHQYRDTIADQITPMITVTERCTATCTTE
jgi:hypothetical protein